MHQAVTETETDSARQVQKANAPYYFLTDILFKRNSIQINHIIINHFTLCIILFVMK